MKKEIDKIHPPHLPPDILDRDFQQKWRSACRLFFISLLSLFAGAVGAFSVLAWMTPEEIFENRLYLSEKNRGRADGLPNDAVIRETRQKTLTVYDRRAKTGEYFSEKSRLFAAAALSSDGWAVGYWPKYAAGEEKNWEIFDYQGNVAKTEKVLKDSRSGLVFLKIQGSGFRIASFFDWGKIADQDLTWFFSRLGPALAELRRSELPTSGADWAWVDRAEYSANPAAGAGELLWNESGELVGFSGDGGKIVCGWKAEQNLSSVLNRGAVVNDPFPVKGFWANGFLSGEGVRPVSGFYVTSFAALSFSTTTLRQGDLILAIGERPAEPDSFARLLFAAPERLSLRVVRAGKETEVFAERIK